jgi:hypothetical protein
MGWEMEASFFEYKGKFVYAFPFVQKWKNLVESNTTMKMEKHLKISFKTPIKFSELTSISMNRFHPVQKMESA